MVRVCGAWASYDSWPIDLGLRLGNYGGVDAYVADRPPLPVVAVLQRTFKPSHGLQLEWSFLVTFNTTTQVLNHMIKGLCGSARAYGCLIRDERFHPQCTAWANNLIQALSTAIDWAHQRQVLVSLADGTYMSLRTPLHLEKFLREKVTDVEIVQVSCSSSCPFRGACVLLVSPCRILRVY